jgi:hypothetical protein
MVVLRMIVLVLTLLLFGAASTRAELAIANCLEESPHIGVASGSGSIEANANAIAVCVKNGGAGGCCNIYATFAKGASGQKTLCLAGAQGSNGDFGYGTGTTSKAAASAAVASCRIGAVAPKFCRQQEDIVCQPVSP